MTGYVAEDYDATRRFKGHRFDQVKAGSHSVTVFDLDAPGLAAYQFACGHCGELARIVRDLAVRQVLLCAACYALTRLPDGPDVWDFCGKPEIRGKGYWNDRNYFSTGRGHHVETWISRPHIMTWPAGEPKPACAECAGEAAARLAAFVVSFRRDANRIAERERERQEAEQEAERVRQAEALAALDDIHAALAAAEAVSLAERFADEGDLDAQREWDRLDPEVAIAAMDAAIARREPVDLSSRKLLPFPVPGGFIAGPDGTWLPRPPRALALQHAGPGIVLAAWITGLALATSLQGSNPLAALGMAGGFLIFGTVMARLNARFWKWRMKRYSKRREEWQAKGLGRWPKD